MLLHAQVAHYRQVAHYFDAIMQHLLLLLKLQVYESG
jgi:hypothetical protein